MNNKILFLPFLASLCFTLSCASIKHVDIPPVSVYANAPDVSIYHGSYPVNLDLRHTELDLHFDWDKAWVLGKATLTLQPHFYPQDSVVLDANGFEIREVALLNGTGKSPAKFHYDGKKLTIALDKKYTKADSFRVSIDYIAKPNELKVGEDIASLDDKGLYFIQPDVKQGIPRQLWSQGETECNSNWFPTINNTMLKMTQQVSLTVPDSMVTLSNGLKKGSKANGDGTRTDTWVQDKPHAPYLTMIAAGVFDIVKDQWRGKEVSYYMEPAFSPYAKMVFGKTPEMIEFFSNKLGVDFPWDKYSQIVVRDFVSGAMENTSATVFFDRMNQTPATYKDETYEDVVAHELFHHWFGDLVTTESWANLPLNESFATYGEYLWLEHTYGQEEADMHGLNDLMAYFSEEKNDSLEVIRYDYANREQMFDEVTYQKGGRILHMLRKTVGDEAFFTALNLYLKEHAYQSVEIHDLRLAFERVTGEDLNWFFNQWFLASGHPSLAINRSYVDSTKTVNIHLAQVQDLSRAPLYRLPMAVDIYTDEGVQRHQITLTKQEQDFSFPVSQAPHLINVDAEKYLLAQKREDKSMRELLYQYQHAPLFMDRLESVQLLGKFLPNQEAIQLYKKALKDPSWIIRLTALSHLDDFGKEEVEAWYPLVKELALNDPRSYVRAAALSSLKTTYKGKNNREVLKKAAADDAPSVREVMK